MLKQLFGLDDSEHKRVVPALFAYVFNRINYEDFLEYVGNRKLGARINDVAKSSGYVMLNCKLYAYAVHAARVQGLKLPRASKYGIEDEDKAILKRLNLRHIKPSEYRAFTLAEFEKVVAHALTGQSLKNYIGRFVSKKMSFLMKSYGVERHDIEGYLSTMALTSMYMKYPHFESYLHLVNVAKAQIHNKGQSYITSQTTKKRNRLQKDSEGMDQAVHVSMDTITEQANPDSHVPELKERLQALASIEHRLPERTRNLLRAAMGVKDEGFSVHLKQCNTAAIERMNYERYMAKLYAYYGTTAERMLVVYQNINNLIHRTTPNG